MPWYQATSRFSDGFNAVLRLQAPAEDKARARLRRELASDRASPADSAPGPAITIRPSDSRAGTLDPR